MNRSLAALAIAALATVPTDAVKTEFMDGAFSFFDKPLWGNNSKVAGFFGSSSNNQQQKSHSSNWSSPYRTSPAAPSKPSGSGFF